MDLAAAGYQSYWDGLPIRPLANNAVDRYITSHPGNARVVAQMKEEYTTGWCKAQDEHRATSIKARMKKRETPFYAPKAKMWFEVVSDIQDEGREVTYDDALAYAAGLKDKCVAQSFLDAFRSGTLEEL